MIAASHSPEKNVMPLWAKSPILGPHGIAVLECLRKKGKKNRLDIEMLLGKPLEPTLTHLQRLQLITKCGDRSASVCYEITSEAHKVLHDALSLPHAVSTPVAPGTMREPYIPSIHGVARIGLARS